MVKKNPISSDLLSNHKHYRIQTRQIVCKNLSSEVCKKEFDGRVYKSFAPLILIDSFSIFCQILNTMNKAYSYFQNVDQ